MLLRRKQARGASFFPPSLPPPLGLKVTAAGEPSGQAAKGGLHRRPKDGSVAHLSSPQGPVLERRQQQQPPPPVGPERVGQSSAVCGLSAGRLARMDLARKRQAGQAHPSFPLAQSHDPAPPPVRSRRRDGAFDARLCRLGCNARSHLVAGVGGTSTERRPKTGGHARARAPTPHPTLSYL